MAMIRMLSKQKLSVFTLCALAVIWTSFPQAVIAGASGLFRRRPPAWEKDDQSIPAAVMDGEGQPYRSNVFTVRRPFSSPFPQLVGADLYAYYVDGQVPRVKAAVQIDKDWFYIYKQGVLQRKLNRL